MLCSVHVRRKTAPLPGRYCRRRGSAILPLVVSYLHFPDPCIIPRLISGIFPLREKTCKIPDLADPRSILTWSVDLVISQISPMAPNCLWVEGNVETVSMLCGKNSGSSGTMGSGKDCGTAASLIVGETVNAMFVKDTAQSVEFIVAARVRTYDPFVTWLEKHKKKVLLCVRKCERSPPPPPPNATIVANR